MRILFGVFALQLAIACGSDVSNEDGAPDGAEAVDPACFEACVAKGEAPESCNEWCATDGDKGEGKGEDDDDTPPVPGPGPGPDPDPDPDDLDKECVECWYDLAEDGGCEDEAEACEDDLACQQLTWCPFLCDEPDCLDECNEVIPTGVEPLTALVQCMACDDAPCADACAGSVHLGYCEP